MSGGFDVTNPADGTRYQVRPNVLNIISPGGHVGLGTYGPVRVELTPSCQPNAGAMHGLAFLVSFGYGLRQVDESKGPLLDDGQGGASLTKASS